MLKISKSGRWIYTSPSSLQELLSELIIKQANKQTYNLKEDPHNISVFAKLVALQHSTPVSRWYADSEFWISIASRLASLFFGLWPKLWVGGGRSRVLNFRWSFWLTCFYFNFRQYILQNIARGTMDPGYGVRCDLNHFYDRKLFEKDHPSYGLNTLGPFCGWQCFFKSDLYFISRYNNPISFKSLVRWRHLH